jgi:hypothetical protein
VTRTRRASSPVGGWGSIFTLSQSAHRRQRQADGLLQGFPGRHGSRQHPVPLATWSPRSRRGDLLHGQRNALDSAYAFDTNVDYSQTQNQPVRFIAEGRDPSATIDSATGGFGKNDGDNELTGIHASDGDPTADGILGAAKPKLGHDGWRLFYTQQHGDNPTYELLVGNQQNEDEENDDNDNNDDQGHGGHGDH